MSNDIETESIEPLKYQLKKFREVAFKVLPATKCDRDDAAALLDHIEALQQMIAEQVNVIEGQNIKITELDRMVGKDALTNEKLKGVVSDLKLRINELGSQWVLKAMDFFRYYEEAYDHNHNIDGITLMFRIKKIAELIPPAPQTETEDV